jgi:hypothetical protein
MKNFLLFFFLITSFKFSSAQGYPHTCSETLEYRCKNRFESDCNSGISALSLYEFVEKKQPDGFAPIGRPRYGIGIYNSLTGIIDDCTSRAKLSTSNWKVELLPAQYRQGNNYSRATLCRPWELDPKIPYAIFSKWAVAGDPNGLNCRFIRI